MAPLAGVALVLFLAGCVTRSPDPASTAPVPPSAPAARGETGSTTRAQALPAPALSPVLLQPARLQPAASDKGAPAQCLAQIEAFAELQSATRVILGPAAFAGSDELVLARMQRRGADGQLLDGRAAVPKPVVLKLLSGADGCVVRLADEPSAAAALPACTCTVLQR